MRTPVLAMVVVALVGWPAFAQDGRVSFELTAGRGTTSDIFHQDLAYTDGTLAGGRSSTWLTVAGASFGSARVAYRAAGPWLLIAEVMDGSTEYHYAQRFTSGTGSFMDDRWGGARRRAFGVGVGRRTMLGVVPLSIQPELGFALHQLRVGSQVECLPTAPSLGGSPSCIPSQRWERTYSAPSVQGGLSLGYSILPRVAVQLHGQYAVGRASTEEGFYQDLLPQYDWMEAPKTQTIRTFQLSGGLRISP
jgi:hypothetical protein